MYWEARSCLVNGTATIDSRLSKDRGVGDPSCSGLHMRTTERTRSRHIRPAAHCQLTRNSIVVYLKRNRRSEKLNLWREDLVGGILERFNWYRSPSMTASEDIDEPHFSSMY
jgi:hypothetical protein